MIEFLQNSEDIFKYILKHWNQLEETVKALNVLYEITIKLQKATCTLSDFYGFWLWSQLKLSKFEVNLNRTNLPKKLLAALEEKKKDLLQNRAMLCAVYLDPRYKSDLTDNQVALVKITLGNLWDELQSTSNPNEIPVIVGHDPTEANADEIDLVEQYFAEMEQGDQLNVQTRQISRLDFLLLLEEYEQVKRLHHSTSVLQYWEEQKITMPQIYDVAGIFVAIPPTQATVERSFSALAFIFTPRRTKLDSVLLEKILTIKLNKDVAQQIFTEQIENIF